MQPMPRSRPALPEEMSAQAEQTKSYIQNLIEVIGGNTKAEG